MDALILGGTRFLGLAIANAAAARGDRVTVFHRGKTAAELPPGVEQILGDREHDLARLDGRRWDAVFDTCGFAPRIVRESVSALAGRIGHYTFVSTISVYASLAPGADESAPLARLADESVEEVTGETYGGLKALCERAAEDALPGRVLNLRAGLLIGPHDYTDRFPYWPRRIARGGDVLVPDAWSQPLQMIDARDAADWMLSAAEAGRTGPYNVSGPAQPLALGDFFERARSALNAEAQFVRVPNAFLLDRGVAPWTEMPLWTAGDQGFMAASLARSLAHGLRHRALETTIHDTLEWDRARKEPPARGASTLSVPVEGSLTHERERELLAAWSAAPGGLGRDAASGRA